MSGTLFLSDRLIQILASYIRGQLCYVNQTHFYDGTSSTGNGGAPGVGVHIILFHSERLLVEFFVATSFLLSTTTVITTSSRNRGITTGVFLNAVR